MNTYATRVNAAYTVLEAAKEGKTVTRSELEAATRAVQEHKGPVVVALEARVALLTEELGRKEREEITRRAVDVQARTASRTARISRRARLEELEARELEARELEDATPYERHFNAFYNVDGTRGAK